MPCASLRSSVESTNLSKYTFYKDTIVIEIKDQNNKCPDQLLYERRRHKYVVAHYTSQG